MRYIDLRPGDVWWAKSSKTKFDSAWLIISITRADDHRKLHDAVITMLLMWTSEGDYDQINVMQVYKNSPISVRILRNGVEITS
jgi:hypothetical protein